MLQTATTAIILNRVDYGEADRILTLLTPDNGKLSLMAKAVRKERSKLAGGIELFSETNISFIRGRGDVGTLTSSRLIKYYENIAKDLERTQYGFEVLKIINKTIEEDAGDEWYKFLKQSLEGLNDLELALPAVQLWINLHWLKLSGHAPNLHTLESGEALEKSQKYKFDFEKMAFFERAEGSFKADHIKLMRLAISVAKPKALSYIQNTDKLLPQTTNLSRTMLKSFVQI